MSLNELLCHNKVVAMLQQAKKNPELQPDIIVDGMLNQAGVLELRETIVQQLGKINSLQLNPLLVILVSFLASVPCSSLGHVHDPIQDAYKILGAGCKIMGVSKEEFVDVLNLAVPYLLELDPSKPIATIKSAILLFSQAKVNTPEQDLLISAKFQKSDVVIVKAFAGCAKTSTLLKFALANQTRTICYVCFNKSAAESAKSKFPPNVTCKTWHALAYGIVKPKNCSNTAPNIPYRVRQTIESFVSSDSTSILESHVPQNSYMDTLQIFNKANEVWNQIVRTKSLPFWSSDIPIKILHTSSFKLKFDIIIVDEAQDMSPNILEFLKTQTHCLRLLVGDSHQQLYRFRNAVNAMDAIPYTRQFSLSISFRFGNGIALLASKVLHVYKGETFPIISNQTCSDVAEYESTPLLKTAHTFLARSNYELFAYAAFLVKHHLILKFFGELEPDVLSKISDMYYLYTENTDEIASALFRNKYSSFDEIVNTYKQEETRDEFYFAYRIVMQFKNETLNTITKIQNRVRDNATIVLSTIHKAKGHEWDTVVLANDFHYFTNPKSRVRSAQEEADILYVAITRAKNKLFIPSSLYSAINDDYKTISKVVTFVDCSGNVVCSWCNSELMNGPAVKTNTNLLFCTSCWHNQGPELVSSIKKKAAKRAREDEMQPEVSKKPRYHK